VLATLTLAAAIYAFVSTFPRGLILAALLIAAAVAAWHGLLRTGPARLVGLGVAALLVVAAVVIVIADSGALDLVLIGAGAFATVAASKVAFAVRVPLPAAPDPAHPVLFFNPKSGGGKAERFRLADEARARGIEPIELTRGADLEQLVRGAVAAGADALAMAGGDGSQAVVAAVAAELDLPYACVPAGTRNHFALDLGVDRDDVVGALDAFVDGREKRVDLAEVNGRVFVNNVSLGLYAEAVQREGYREAKIRTILDTVPEALGPGSEGLDLHWREPDQREHSSAAAILVSNNRYRLGKAVGSGTRPCVDDGLLGITVAGRGEGRRGWREWTVPEFEVRAAGPVPAGVDGEALVLGAPLRFVIRPGVLRVRLASAHPGASPSTALPERSRDTPRDLLAIAAGRRPTR
jgi:diacylglycerol kinase family enzyme